MSAQFYRPQREDRGRSRLTYITALIIIVFLLDLVAGGRLRSAVRLGASYTYVSFVHVAEMVLGSGYFTSRAALEEENARLRAELALYQQKDATYTAVQDEDTKLRSLEGLAAQVHGRAASIISSLSASAYGTFTIDTGIDEGVARGSVVYTPDGYAIGIVSETGSHSSLVTELFAPDASLEVVAGDTRLVLQGQGGGNARAHAGRDATIAKGTIVRAPNVDAPVGIVEHVEASPNGADTDVYVRIPANLQTLTLVYVVRK